MNYSKNTRQEHEIEPKFGLGRIERRMGDFDTNQTRERKNKTKTFHVYFIK